MTQEQSPAPTEQEWRELYHAANDFKRLAPWDWMFDSDIFAVRNPETNEIGYCCIMGQAGEHFALAVYRGDAGLRGYVRTQSGEFWPPDVGALFVQDCLMASFEDRDLLSRIDRDQIKALGLKYRGRNAWPQFRNYTPGYAPWYLSATEARFLTLALQQSIDVAARFRDNEQLLDAPVDGQILIRVAEKGAWHDTWHTPNLSETALPAPPPLDEVRVQRLRTAGLPKHGAWESDCFFTPAAVRERPDQRPYYPRLGLFVDRMSGMMLPPLMAPPDDWQQAYQNHLLSLISQLNVVPKTVDVPSADLRALLEPVAEVMGITLRVARRLPVLEEARDSLTQFLGA